MCFQKQCDEGDGQQSGSRSKCGLQNKVGIQDFTLQMTLKELLMKHLSNMTLKIHEDIQHMLFS
jgi:hypothetical protein